MTDFREALTRARPGVLRVAGRRGYDLSGTAWSEDRVVTTVRAVAREEGISVGLADGSEVEARLLGRDPSTDLALLEVASTALAAPKWVEAGDLAVGQPVVRTGAPRGLLRAAAGVISVLEESRRTPQGGRIEPRLESDAASFPGFSGGPLLTLSGEVIGINTAAFRGQFPTTIPTATVRRVVESLEAHGRIRRGYLGVSGQPVKLAEAVRETLQQRAGLLLLSVEAGSPAADAGLAMGDVLVRFEGHQVGHPGALMARLDGDLIGTEATVTYIRGGEQTEAKVKVGERP